MGLTSLRDQHTLLAVKQEETDTVVRQTQATLEQTLTKLEQRDEAHLQALARISALEVLCDHLKPKHPELNPVPYPGPGDPPRKNKRRMWVNNP